MEGATKQAKFFIPLHQTKLSGQVSGPIARFTIILTFRYTKEDCPETVDAVNRFLSRGDAAIEKVRAFFGGNEVESKLMERGKAETEFHSARKKGKQFLLMIREPRLLYDVPRRDQAGRRVKVQTSFAQMGDPQGVGFEFRIPLTAASRYVRGDEDGAMQGSAFKVVIT